MEPTAIAFILPADRRERRRICRLAAKLHKARIEATPNGSFAVSVWLSPWAQIQLFADTRKQLSKTLDRLFDMLADPQSAIGLYRYFASLNARAEAGNLARAADMFSPDGRITNLDVAGTA